MVATNKSPEKLLNTFEDKTLNLSLQSTLDELVLCNAQVEYSCPGKEVAQMFQTNPLLPGIIIKEQSKFIGMISRRQFLEMMSRPYGLELFSRRSLDSLYRFVNQETLQLKGETQIVEAARLCLQRSDQLVYEPIVVELKSEVYRLLGVHQLLLADSQIHQLTCQLLNKQSNDLRGQIEKIANLGPQDRISNLRQIASSFASEVKNPVYWLDNLEFLFLYCQQIREILLVQEISTHYTASSLTELKKEFSLDFVLQNFPQTLQNMKMGTERLNKIITGLQVLLERLKNSNNNHLLSHNNDSNDEPNIAIFNEF
ncbi:MAG: hypothetical protein WA919_29320 [Coleofasciculaceae cyanobacterium]